MNLTEAQKEAVAKWLEQGAKLSEIQKRLESEFGLRPTYMEVKLLVSDLDVLPKDQPEPVRAPVPPPAPPADKSPRPGPKSPAAGHEPAVPAAGKGLAVSVDRVTRPGAVASGNVTFSDGNTAVWYIDTLGQLGLAPAKKGYRPPAADVQDFQLALQNELARLGL